MIKRGANIFILGWVLNILRIIPYLVLYIIWEDPSLLRDKIITEAINLDILQFAGLAFIHINTRDAAVCVMSALQLISVCFFIAKLLPGPVINICKNISSNLNDIYLAQWVIIHRTVGFLINGILKTELSTGYTLLVSAVITAASLFAGDLLSKRRKKKLKATVTDSAR